VAFVFLFFVLVFWKVDVDDLICVGAFREGNFTRK
jgi:hypothetical protein